MIAKILINTTVKNLNKVYDYKVPVHLEEQAQVGKRVEVNFGRSKQDNDEGIIVKLIEENELVNEAENKVEEKTKKYKLKEIVSILDDISYINEERLKLAKYISYLYFCNVYDALKLMLPPGTSSKNASKTLNTKKETILVLMKSESEIMQDIENEVIKSPKHIRLLKFLIENDFVLISDVIDGLAISRAVINTVVKNGYIKIEKVDPPRDLLEDLQIEKTFPKEPTTQQKEAIDKINSYIYEEKYKECLLFGVTGSGKTEVYLQVLESVLSQGRTAVILVPEISLTYQTLTRFVSRFGNNVAILHSKMTVSKRKEEYKRIKNKEVNIVIGARSAIFAPIDNIGIVIIDEEHDSSYYSYKSPKYSTKQVARYICKNNDAILLLGSATPEISTYYMGVNGEIELIRLDQRPGNAVLPDITLIDMKEERLLGNKSFLSIALKEEILKNIQNKEQTMLFLNRRGYTSYLTCNDCSHIFKCPNCDIAMTYHKNSNLLLCHYCSHVEKNVKECPKCLSENISSGTTGTQKLEEELKEIYPETSILRMDADTTMTRDSHQKILDEFKNENINVLIGTQMISKGHDISNVTLVGVLGVDSMLGMNDYLASEKAFSNISQVARKSR
jgi:primosomal protein N' (replication factor Y)